MKHLSKKKKQILSLSILCLCIFSLIATRGLAEGISGENHALSSFQETSSEQDDSLSSLDDPSSIEDVNDELTTPMPFATASGTYGTVDWDFDGITLTLSSGVFPDGSNFPWHTYNVYNTAQYIVITGPITAGNSLNSCFQLFSRVETITGLEYIDTSNVTDMYYLFGDNLNLLNVDGIENWNTSNVKNMSRVFYDCRKVENIDVSQWDTSNVETLEYMFYRTESLTSLDISNWETSKVTNMYGTFNYTAVPYLELNQWDVSNVTTLYYTFSGAPNLTGINLANWDTSKVTNMEGTFNNTQNLVDFDITNWDVSSVTILRSTFSQCNSITSLDLSKWDTRSLQNMNHTFAYNPLLEELNVSTWDTSKVTDMAYTFTRCPKLTSIDLTQWDTSKSQTMYSMFSESGFTELNLSNFTNPEMYYATMSGLSGMFMSCPNLKKVDISSLTFPDSESINLSVSFYLSPIVEFTIGDNCKLSTSIVKSVTGYSDEWMYLGEGKTVYSTVDDLTTAYNANGAGGTYIRLGVEYDIELNGNGGKDSSGATTKTISTRYKVDPRDGVEPVKLTNIFSKTGAEYKNWNTVQGGTGTSYANNAEVKNLTTTADAKVVFYAQWENIPYTVTFNVNGGVGTIPDLTPVYYDTTFSAPTGTITKTHFELEGWYKDAECTTEWDFATDKMPADDLTLYAGWEQVEWKVSYSVNGGEGQSNYPDIYVRYGTKLTAPTNPTKPHFEITGWYKEAAATNPWIFATDVMPKQDITLYAGWEQVEWQVSYFLAEGEAPTKTEYVRYGTLITEAPFPEKRLFKCNGWYTDPALTDQWNFSADVMPKKDLNFYAGWERTHWEVFFNTNGGNDANLPPEFLVPVKTPLDISAFQPGGSNAPTYLANVLLGWKDQNGTIIGTEAYIPTSDVYLTAEWTSLSDIINLEKENVVTYKNESSPEEVETFVGANAEYTDYLGKTHAYPVTLDWNPIWLTEGGVNEIKPYILDSSTGEKVYGKENAYLYVLNRPYITGTDEIWIFVGEWINPDNIGVSGYGEIPNFEEKRIDRGVLNLNFNSDNVDVWTRGTYWAYYSGGFEDYDLKKSTFNFPVLVHVQERVGLTKEEQQQVDSSNFWLKVTTTYHLMKAGQIIDITPENYMDGGTLRNETVPEGVGYDRQLNVQVGEFVFMSPNILNMLQEEKTGQLNVNLEGRSWVFNSETTNAVGNDYLKGYYDLRMDFHNEDALTNLVGANTPQMQLHFSMNRPWFATPIFVINPNDSIKNALAEGSTPYLFHYNKETNELELVGAMKIRTDGKLEISMNGVYKDYVILTDLPEDGHYRITEQTNTLDGKTYEAVANNLIDSGHALPIGNGLNGISTVNYSTNFEILEASSESNNDIDLFKWIGIGIVSVALLGGIVFYLKKKKTSD